MAEEYGLFPEDVGTEDEIRDAGAGSARLGRRKTDETRRIPPPVRRPRSSSRSARAPRPGRSPGGRASACFPRTSIPDAPTREGTACTLPPWPSQRGYADVRWGTYRQIQARGGQVRKGEQWHPHPLLPGPSADRRHRRARAAQVTDNEGKRVYRHERMRAPVVRQYNVFNAEQTDGLPARPAPAAEPLWKVHQQAETRPRGQRGSQSVTWRGTGRFTIAEPRRDRAPRAGTVPLGQPLLPDRAPRAGAQHRPSGADEPRHAHPRDRLKGLVRRPMRRKSSARRSAR